MWLLSRLHFMNSLIVSKSVFSSLLWGLSALACLLLFVGWLNLQSIGKLLGWINSSQTGSSLKKIRTDLESGSGGYSTSMECSRVPAIQAISTSVTFGFLITAMTLFSVGIWQTDMREAHRYDNERGPYKMRVFEKVKPRLVRAKFFTMDDKPLDNELRKFAVCPPPEIDPDFDAGHTYKVAFEISEGPDGECNTFTGPHADYKEVQ
jgi:hypothetical protein